jgi:hypothetical protein
MAFNVARHLPFIAGLEATSMAGFDYTPPTYHAMQTKHIKPKVKQVKTEIKKARIIPLLYTGPPYVLMIGTMSFIGR